MAIKAMDTDVYLLSANAVSENKIGGTLEQAIYRARNVAAPKNALGLYCNTPCAMTVQKRLTEKYLEQYPENNQLQWQKFIEGLTEEELNTHCYDCKSPDRICGSLLIHWIKPASMEAEIIIIRNNKGF